LILCFIYRISQIQESGIYEHEIRKSLNPKGYGPDIDAKIHVNSQEFKPLSISQLKGAFIVQLVGLAIAFLVLLMEKFSHKYSDTFRELIIDVLRNSRIISYLLEIYYFFIRENRVNPQI